MRLKSNNILVNNWNKIFFILIVVLFFIINSITPLIGEDYKFSVGKDHIYLYNFNIIIDLFSRIKYQSMHWNTRIGESISIFFGGFDKIYFNIFNSFMAVWYIYLTCIFQPCRHIKNNIFCLVFSCLLILFCQPCLGEIFFWRTGSTNYLWGIILLLVFMIPLIFLLYEEQDILKNKNLIIHMLYIIFGLVAGVTNENTVLVTLFIYFILFLRNKKRPYYFYLSGVALLVSYLFLLFGPSTVFRRNFYKKMFGVISYKDNIVSILCKFFHSHVLYIIILSLFTALILALDREKFYMIKYNVLLLGLSLISLLPLIFVPYVEVRSFLLIDFFTVSLLVNEFMIIFHSVKLNKKYIGIFMISILLVKFCMIFNVYYDYYKFVNNRNEEIEQHIKNNIHSEYIWRPYPKQEYLQSRVLTTREDYLIDIIEHLNNYFGCKITY